MFNSKKKKSLKVAFLSALTMIAAGCERLGPTENAIQLKNWGKKVSVVTEAGVQCWLPCGFWGEKYIRFSKGEYPVNIIARLPDANDPSATESVSSISGDDIAAYGVIKTKEELPLQGAVSLFFKLDISEENDHELKALYDKIPPKSGESDEDYIKRIMERFAKMAMQPVKDIYRKIPVDKVNDPEENIQDKIIQEVEKVFESEGLSFVKLKSVITASLNLGPKAESANQLIGLAEVQKTVADRQKEAAAKLRDSASELATVTGTIVTKLRAAGVTNQDDLDSLVCLHLMARDPQFADAYQHPCFEGFGKNSGNAVSTPKASTPAEQRSEPQ